MTIDEMLTELLSVKKPDARLKRYLEWLRPKKDKDGNWYSARTFCGRANFSSIDGEWWEERIAPWVEYVRGNGLCGK